MTTKTAPATTTPRPSRRRRLALGCGGALAVLAVALGIAFVVLDEPRPVGTPGPEAEALADRMETALGGEAFARTGALRWTFPSGARYLWDRERHWARIAWDDVVVLLDLDAPERGVASRGGQRVQTGEAELLRAGWERWANDSFWLIAPFKVRDPGTTRSLVRIDGEDALLVSYASGGVTPGDAYLWLLEPDGTPRAWRMWVSILPIGGVEAGWSDWITLPTGARIATHRALGPVDLEMREVEGASHLAELEPGDDPFAALAELAEE